VHSFRDTFVQAFSISEDPLSGRTELVEVAELSEASSIPDEPLLDKPRNLQSKRRHVLEDWKHKRITMAEAEARLKVLVEVASQPAPAPAPRDDGGVGVRLDCARSSDGIAVIGISGRFPDAQDVHEFWSNLATARDSVKEFPAERGVNIEEYFDRRPQAEGKTYTKRGAFLDDIDKFDPLFFGISPREAAYMDPSERLFLQEAWRAIEDAGYAPASISGKPWGVFACAKGDYSVVIRGRDPGYFPATDSFAAARLCYILNLVGSTVCVDTACSSTLTAIAYACDSLTLGNCTVAVAGGGGIYCTPGMLVTSSQSLLLSPDGKCYTFDSRANGTVLGEAVGAVVLKPLRAAIEDNDHIYGVIKGWGTNQDGSTNGITAPSVKAQIRLQTNVYEKFGIDPDRIEMVEAHGTGTALGDRIEAQALNESFRKYTQRKNYCALGSVKTNIGHAFFGAGVAGVIKVLMSLKHEKIPASNNVETVSPGIDDGAFFVNTALRSWTRREGKPRCAAINSFGATGVNAHLVIEEYRAARNVDALPVEDASTHPALIVLSARNEDRLRALAEQLLAHVSASAYTNFDLADIAYTLQIGREAMEQRLAFTTTTIAELQEKLRAYLDGKARRGEIEGCYHGEVKRNKEALSIFEADEDLQDALTAWMRRGKYTKLLDAWVKGVTVDWTKLYEKPAARATTQRRRVSLPTYPFSKERHWVDSSCAREEVAQLPPMPAPETVRWLKVTERWTAAPLDGADQACHLAARSKGAQRVLVVFRRSADVDGIRNAFGRAWAEDANKLLVDVIRLPELSEASEGRPLDDYLAKNRIPDAVFYFSGVAEPAFAARELQGILEASQALLHRAPRKAVNFYYCYPATDTTTGLYQEGLSGLFRAIAMECPEHCYRSVEYPAAASSQDYMALVQEWLQHRAPLVAAQLPMVRHRDGVRYVAVLTELTGVEQAKTPVRLLQGATYLMVGALGEVGQIVCRALARRYRPRLVFLSRRPLDAECQRVLATIADAGAQVIYRSVDITDEALLADTFATIKAEVDEIRGVFHFARSVSDGPLLGKTFASFQRTIAAKVAGTLHIDSVTADEPLDFFVVFSSMASFGIEGSADYGYATAFQNAFVRDRNRQVEAGKRAGRSLALCWGQWLADAYSNEERNTRMRQLGFELIDDTSSFAIMEETLRQSGEVVGLMAVSDRRRVMELFGLVDSEVEAVISKESESERKPKVPSLDENVMELGRKFEGDFDALREALVEQSEEQLAELYQSLKRDLVGDGHGTSRNS
jgi:acyl transferase domain-containing protein/NAD(P)-dependent dehydrogenase (short-subunit alcohol dehydrogenase family)